MEVSSPSSSVVLSGGFNLERSMQEEETPHRLEMELIGLLKPDQVHKMIVDGGTKLLGLGAFGAVFAGSYLDEGVAVKIMKMQKPDDPTVQQAFKEEIEKLMQRPSEHIIGYRGACLEPVKVTFYDKHRKQESTVEGIAIVMELATGGDLEHLMRDKKGQAFKVPLTLFQKMILARDIARGLAWLHCGFEAPIIHRDLACKNIFISKHETANNYRAKLGDLGLAITIPKGFATDEGEGTCSIRAPEVLANILEEKQIHYDHRIDLYSFGVVLWEILTRKKAYLGKLFDPVEFVNLICEQHYREPIPPETLPRLKNLIEMLWSHDPASRLPSGKATDWVVDELERVLIEVCIEDEEGRSFWMEHFFKSHMVPWKEFSAKFYEHIEQDLPVDLKEKLEGSGNSLEISPGYAPLLDILISEKAIARAGKDDLRFSTPPRELPATKDVIQLRCLRTLVTKRVGVKNKLYVHMLEFGKLLNRMGPWMSDKEPEPLLARLASLLANSWFHGDVASEEAGVLLKHQKPGTYLLRFGSIPFEADLPPKHCFSMMIKTRSDSIKKLQITRSQDTGKFMVSGAEYRFDTLEGLVERLCKDLNIDRPCPPHPFADIFQSGYDADK